MYLATVLRWPAVWSLAVRGLPARSRQTLWLVVLTMLYLDTARRPQRIHLPAHGATTMIATRDRGGHHSDTTTCRSTYDVRISSPLWSVVASAHSRCGQRGSGSVGSSCAVLVADPATGVQPLRRQRLYPRPTGRVGRWAVLIESLVRRGQPPAATSIELEIPCRTTIARISR